MRKKLQTLFIALVIFTCTGMTQTFYTVNNSQGVPADFHDLQQALDAVPAGSILLLQNSGLSYGYGVIRKPIVIYGSGYFLGQNAAPNTQARPNQSVVSHLTFMKGSQGSIVSGLSFILNSTFDGTINQRIVCDSTSDISISRCYFDYVPFAGFTHNRMFLFRYSSAISISQSYVNLQEALFVPIQSTGLTFSNNIIIGGGGAVNMIDVYQTPFNYSFYNNSISATIQYIDFSNGSFYNNVIIQNNPAITVSVSGAMTFADHNVSNVNIFPAASTNITNADGANTYAGNSNPSISSNDGIWKLKTGSPAIGYANDGSDCGAYGSNKPYVLSGIPPIPNFYFASPQQVGTGGGGLNIHFKIKANN